MFIIEGPDGSGKTSLVNKLSLDLNMPVAEKAVGHDTIVHQTMETWVKRHLDRGFQPVLFDRFALYSEPIYSILMNRTPRETFNNLQWMMTQFAKLADIGPVIIICLPEFDEVWKNCQRDEYNRRLFPNREKLQYIYTQYQFLVAQHMQMICYDYKKNSYEDLKKYVQSVREARE